MKSTLLLKKHPEDREYHGHIDHGIKSICRGSNESQG